MSYVEAGHSRRAAAAHFCAQGVALVCHQFDDRFSRARGGYASRRSAAGLPQQARPAPRVFILRRVAEKDDISMPEPGR